jgi:phage gp29-like protein
MAKKKTIPKPNTKQNEASPAHTGHYSEFGFGGAMYNPDSIIRAKGSGIDIYDIVMRDDQVKAALTQRFARIVSAEWYIEPGGESRQDKKAADFLQEVLESIDFDNATRLMLYGIAFGYAVSEIIWGLKDGKIIIEDIRVRDRSRFAFDKDHNLMLKNQLTGMPQKMPDNKFWIYSTGANHGDNPYGLGLAHWLYWPVFFKRGGQQSWLKFLDKYGTPTAKGTFQSSATNEEKIKLLEALRAISTDAGVIIPEGMQIELIEATRGGTASYEQLYDRMNEAIVKVVLTQTLTSGNDSVGSMALGNVHADSASLLAKEDADTLSQSFNTTVAAWLTHWNFPNAVPPKVWRRIEREPSNDERAELDKKLFEIGYQSTEDRIKEIYGEGYERKQIEVGPQIPEEQEQEEEPQEPAFADVDALPAVGRSIATHVLMESEADRLARDAEPIIEKQIDGIIGMLQETGDYTTAKEKLEKLLSKDNPAFAEVLSKGTVGARLEAEANAEKDINE